MKTYCTRLLAIIAVSASLSGCSSITDSIAASSQTFTNTTKYTTDVSTKDSSSSSSNTQQAIEFAKVNWMKLSANMSKGQGEHLAAIASLLKVEETQKPAFYAMTQNKFTTLYRSKETTGEQLVQQLQIEIAKL